MEKARSEDKSSALKIDRGTDAEIRSAAAKKQKSNTAIQQYSNTTVRHENEA